MKHLILFISTCLLVYSVILSADILEDAEIYKTDTQRFIELSNNFDWLTSYEYEIIKTACAEYGVDIKIICAIIQTESGGNHKAFNRNRNHTADYGIMQINSVHGIKKDIESNINFGVKYFSKCMRKYKNIERSISAYNTGLNAKWINESYVNKVKGWL